MTKNEECSIVRDLLPVYAENECSPDTNRFVSAHLETCPECRELNRCMKSELPFDSAEAPEMPEQLEPLKKIKKKNRRTAIILSAVILCLLAYDVVFEVMGFGYGKLFSREPIQLADKSSEVLLKDGADAFVKTLTPDYFYREILSAKENDGWLANLQRVTEEPYETLYAGGTSYMMPGDVYAEHFSKKPSTMEGVIHQTDGEEAYIKYCFTNSNAEDVIVDDVTFEKFLRNEGLTDGISSFEIGGKKYYINRAIEAREYQTKNVELKFPDGEVKIYSDKLYILNNYGASCKLLPTELYDYCREAYQSLDTLYSEYTASYIEYGFEAFTEDERNLLKEQLDLLIAENGKIVSYENDYPAWRTGDYVHVFGHLYFENERKAFFYYDINDQGDIFVRGLRIMN